MVKQKKKQELKYKKSRFTLFKIVIISKYLDDYTNFIVPAGTNSFSPTLRTGTL